MARKAKAKPVEEDLPLTLPAVDGAALMVFPPAVVLPLRRMTSLSMAREKWPARIALISSLRQEGVTFTTLALATALAYDLADSVCVVELNWWWPGMAAVLKQDAPASPAGSAPGPEASEPSQSTTTEPSKSATTESSPEVAESSPDAAAEPTLAEASLDTAAEVKPSADASPAPARPEEPAPDAPPTSAPPSSSGLAAVMDGVLTLDDALVRTGLPNLTLLPAGLLAAERRSRVARSSELRDVIGRLAERFDRLLLDVPAIHDTSDAVTLAGLAECCLLVIRQGATLRNQTREALDDVSHLPMLGVVINRSRVATPRLVLRFISQE